MLIEENQYLCAFHTQITWKEFLSVSPNLGRIIANLFSKGRKFWVFFFVEEKAKNFSGTKGYLMLLIHCHMISSHACKLLASWSKRRSRKKKKKENMPKIVKIMKKESKRRKKESILIDWRFEFAKERDGKGTSFLKLGIVNAGWFCRNFRYLEKK